MNKKHALLMFICCLIPIAGFLLVSIFDIPLKSVFYFALILVCPLSHLLMMKYMGHDESHHSDSAVVIDHSNHMDVPQISKSTTISD
jgi:uncharacterized membrane protein